ncbi:hypothetical protein [Candidatus Enterococcus mansonii]|uniref:Uncharacterized protein n=1 Tax=Candidatus Enterococcus mansonii TaxID=1834181 RepID=A0A242C5W2_9ENTE|nr:hypothetical protein [Enterococcus sp. 4G2_DIV0659]OTO05581.1 hypothetical protein A5880_002754 [Enterococcus sp. 4G2_DIV0659]
MEIKNNHFNNSPFIFGSNNRVSYLSADDSIDWDKFYTEIKATLTKLPQDSQEFQACTELLVETSSKNQSRVTELLKKYLPEFTSDVFSNFASTFLSDLVWKMLGNR